jgi:hypothetical protein
VSCGLVPNLTGQSMYDSADPRAVLGTEAPAGGSPSPASYPADYVAFHESPPALKSGGSRHWYARGQNFVVGYSECNGPVTLRRATQPDEWMLLLPGGDVSARIAVAGQALGAPGRSLAVIPPGDSEITIIGSGTVVRIFSRNASDLCAQAINDSSYAEDHFNVAPLTAWPVAADGPMVRVYSLDVPPEGGRFGRIWRCSTLMVNVLDPADGPRDETRLSPHSHEDFEQGSLALQGEYIHHIRWPWTTNRRTWRPDDHQACGSPSLAVIPPPAIHTSQAVGEGTNQLVDIFAPPRRDFSERPGWVLNAAEYPMPQPG